ncbi:alpha/beta hydrolase family protein [Paraburkholderia phenazinium]|jgi:predicted dienelactone hydrolase|uniref:Predicted dienelactone hydrolase n=1 Tax=Paraburkholderia phenazinium TaxID=60549 RepID=A0A1G8F9T9_9BURK|nr:prolyl oligopeptidase family serine peptidase [Paraburkholderia phenazinium]SDH78924.1 Predicted dienelactone hydrolase [Paraburkholderia phenazinium]
MLRRYFAAVTLITACWTNAATAADNDNPAPYHVGAAMRVFHPTVARNWRGAQTEALITNIWYPVDANIPEAAHTIDERGQPLFEGHALTNGAPLSAAHAKYPLVLLSHGTAGTAASLDWLASSLAANGYIVAGVNHPGNNGLERLTPDGFMLWWERATDQSEVLDGLLADPLLGKRIDTARIGAAGFSLGGYTVLELAGARTDLQGFLNFCASPAADAICHPPEMQRLQGGVPAPAQPSPDMLASMARSGASYRDTRIKAVFAIAPALGEAFNQASFAGVEIPISLLAGTNDVTVPVKTNIQRVAGFMPNAKVTLLPGATHYTFMDTCVPAVVERLARICQDPPGVDRDAIHTQASQTALDFFSRTLSASPQ